MLTTPLQSDDNSGVDISFLAERRYRVIIFDWDGTAGVNRQSDAGEVAVQIERLLSHGVWICIVTGTNFGNVERQLVPLIEPPRRERLIVGANRGSEIFGFD